ncbi:MAG: DUF6036 family nucleotidyltransferase [Actinomycetota bacterium]
MSAVGEQLASRGAQFELVVIGGSALQALGLIQRATADVDVVALVKQGRLTLANPLPKELASATEQVARDYDLPPNWLNAGPTELLQFGLPEGFEGRVERRAYGPALTVLFAGRLDQIHFKLYAMVDQGAGRHEADLRSLNPSAEELLMAARWARTQDPSEGFRGELLAALRYLGVPDADIGP